MSIKIPKQFEKLIRKDPACYAGVSQLCLNAEDLFRDSPEFFPDYTIHGIDHINEVLEHADALIARKTRSKLSPQDIAFLVAAIVIHDLGMFLRADGIRRLVRGDRRHDRIAEIDNCGWEKTWEDFVDRTKRYSEEKMRYLFGRNIRVVGTCVDSSNMTDDDKRVIGDFLRQNHPRMAHEIAVFSFPGTQDIDLFARTAFTADDRKMIGLLARSHGKPIRDMEAYIHSEFGRGAKPYNTPVYYLMAVLRIADYLDAGKHRAPVIREKHQKIPVPVSVEEWTWNQRIDRARCRWDLTEKNRYIYARPESSIEFVQLDKWLNSVQSELDTAWSILAEKYTEEPIRLSIHRIVCNIHEPGVRETLNRQFLTEEVKVTANPEITKLMIAPLYGDDPTYGVRELPQNAVDACLERKDKDPTHTGLVTVSIDPWEDPDTGENLGVFTIEDNGIRVYRTESGLNLRTFGLNAPFLHVALMDPGAKLDIDLARSKFQTFPEESELLDQVLRYHIARLLMTRWNTDEDYRQNTSRAFTLGTSGNAFFLLTHTGFTLNHASVLLLMDIRQCVILYPGQPPHIQHTPRYLPFSSGGNAGFHKIPYLLSGQYCLHDSARYSSRCSEAGLRS